MRLVHRHAHGSATPLTEPDARSKTPAFASALRPLAPLLLGALTLALLLLVPSVAAAADGDKDMFTRWREDYGLIGGAAGAFAGGLLTCLTPCVYPMIAITVSVFGAKQAKSRQQAVLLSASFVMGIAVLFTSLLVGAALTGEIFGAALQKWWVNAAIALVMGAMALSMFGAFELTLPEGLMQRLSSVGGVGYGGAFALGLVSSLIAAPCTGPVLTSVILWIGKTQSVALGALVGFMYSLGLGLPFFLVGAFAVGLPKGGKWMIGVKSFFGTVMLIVAANFLRYAIPPMAAVARHDTTFMAVCLGAVALGVVLGAVHLDWSDGGIGVKIRKGLGIALATVGGFLFWVAFEKPPEMPLYADTGGVTTQAKRLLSWEHSEQTAKDLAQKEKRPLMIDFTAEWCGACKELAKHTFADPRVMEKAGHFVAVKIDATEDEQLEAVKKTYGVVGLPTVLIYDSSGKERQRFTEFVPPERFLAAIEGIQ